MIMDCHTHTKNSPDACNTVAELYARAENMGLDVLAITDHCEVNRFFGAEHYTMQPKEYDTYDFGKDFEISMRENTAMKALARKEKHKTELLCGIELGQAPFDFDLAERIISDKRLDFVIGSIHQICGFDDFAFINYDEIDVKYVLTKYFQEMLSLCNWNRFNILAHITYPLRYIEGEKHIQVDMSVYKDIIAECFRVLIKNGKGIEINTSGFRQAYGKPLPTLEYVKLFKDLGGEVLSVGSDSHCTEDLAKNIKDGIGMAKEAGFTHLTYFRNRSPKTLDI